MRDIVPVRSAVLLVCVLFCLANSAFAQNGGSNKSFVRNLFFQGVIDDQESPALVQQIAADSADAISKFVAAALAGAPVASSSAGFSYVKDRTTGERRLKSTSFGPTFAERPLSNGKGVWSVGANFQFSQTRFEGAFGTADGRSIGLPIFDNTATYRDGFVQFVTRRTFLETRAQTVHFTASYGLTDRVDVGAIIPVVSLRLEGRMEDAFDVTRNFNAGEVNFAIRPGPVGTFPIVPTASQSATGMGDVTVRLKYSLAGERSDGVAVAADVRLPTGSEDDMLGAGKASVKMLILFAKSGVGPASFHGNAGYTAGGLSDEVNYVVGADTALLAKKQLSASVSLLGRTLRSAALPSRVDTVRRTVDTGPTGVRDIVVDRFIWETTSLNLVQLATGVKFHVGGQWLLDASVLFPINERGFQPGVTPSVGLTRTWTPPR